MRTSRTAAVIAATLLAGCAQLLPKAQSEVSSPWKSFQEAREAIGRIAPGLTTATELRPVVYTLYGGQPNLHEQEVTRHPLGPIQDFGESLPLGNLLK